MINWNKTAIEEQEKLEQEQNEVLALHFILKDFQNIFIAGRCCGKTFMILHQLELLIKYNALYALEVMCYA